MILKKQCFIAIAIVLAAVMGNSAFAATVALNTDCFNHGDVNLDGEITATDAQLAFFIVLELFTPTYEQACAADCNGDGIGFRLVRTIH
jgi:hypothetical protein